MASWPAARIDRIGSVHANHPEVLEALRPVLSPDPGVCVRLTESAAGRLWAMRWQDHGFMQWQMLDPVCWPFIGIIGWSSQFPDALQLAVCPLAAIQWQVDDAWRELLAATAAVRVRCKGSVA